MTDSAIDGVFEDWQQHSVPGGAVAVISNGRLIHCRGYGSGNLENNVPFGLSQKFSIASITKQFTTFCILLLEEQGKLNLDDDVRRHFPELADFGAPITIRHLCHNSSGIRDYITLAPLTGGQLLDKLHREFATKLICRQQTLNCPPGTQYRYSNSNFVILSYIIERLTGLPLGEVFDRWLFQPLGMTDTVFVGNSRRRPDNAIVGYSGTGQSGFRPWSWDADMSGDGGIWSTINDMIRWEMNFEHNTIGSPGLVERMAQTAPLKGGAANDYALGLQTGNYRGAPWQGHGGGFEGFMSQRMRFPDERLSIIIFANHTDNLIDRTFRIADSLLRNPLPVAQPWPVDLSAADIHERLGFYQDTQSGLAFDLGLDRDALVLELPGAPRRLHAEGPRRFRAEPRSIWKGWLEFGALEGNPTMAFSLEQGSETTVARCRGPNEPGLALFEGVYRSEELQTSYTLEKYRAELQLSCDGPGGRIDQLPLERKGPESFVLSREAGQRWALDLGAVFWFPPASGAHRPLLVVSGYAAEGIRFSRVA